MSVHEQSFFGRLYSRFLYLSWPSNGLPLNYFRVLPFTPPLSDVTRMVDNRALTLHLVTFLMFFILVTSGNRTPGSRSYSDPFGYLGRLGLHSPTHTQASFKALGCSFQLTHMSGDDDAVQLIEPRRPNRRLQRSQRCHNGEFRHISISTRQRSLQCKQNLRGPFLRATLPMRVGSCARAMADNGETKGLITPPPR